MKIGVVLTEKQGKLMKKIGADPQVTCKWLVKEICKVLEETENIYGALDELDECMVAEAIMEGAKLKKDKRLKEYEKNREEIRQREEIRKAKDEDRERLLKQRKV